MNSDELAKTRFPCQGFESTRGKKFTVPNKLFSRDAFWPEPYFSVFLDYLELIFFLENRKKGIKIKVGERFVGFNSFKFIQASETGPQIYQLWVLSERNLSRLFLKISFN